MKPKPRTTLKKSSMFVDLKDRTKKRCIAKIKQRRRMYLNRSRMENQELIRTELMKEISNSSNINNNEMSNTTDEDGDVDMFDSQGPVEERDFYDIILEIEEEIEEEVKKLEREDEENLLMLEYRKNKEEEEIYEEEEFRFAEKEMMDEYIEDFYKNGDSGFSKTGNSFGGANNTQMNNSNSEEVVCPVCRNNNLGRTNFSIYCKCGFRLSTKNETISLKYLKNRLSEAYVNHKNGCDVMPVFQKDMKFKNEFLVITCNACGIWKPII